MLANTALSEGNIEREVDRYIAWLPLDTLGEIVERWLDIGSNSIPGGG